MQSWTAFIIFRPVSMKVNIQLFGILGRKLPQYSAAEGVEIELPDGSTAGDLLKFLTIPDAWAPAIAMDSRLLRYEDGLRDNANIRIFQSVHGG
jgi:sulfur carrier protein ThiS